tara:strand:- start:120 stop:353 length:234 start_codon:yes stop_codon:yes gene_type:complete
LGTYINKVPTASTVGIATSEIEDPDFIFIRLSHPYHISCTNMIDKIQRFKLMVVKNWNIFIYQNKIIKILVFYFMKN